MSERERRPGGPGSRLKVIRPGAEHGGEERERAKPRQWRSVADLEADPELTERRRDEFPPGYFDFDPGDVGASGAAGGLDRRSFLQLSAASLALAGAAGCTKQPPEKIVPYIRQPEEIVPGKPLWFATAMPLGGYAMPLLAESHEGRPTKLEGNPDHPASLGATDLFAQASVVELYDLDRLKAITEYGQLRSWSDFVASLADLQPPSPTADGAAANATGAAGATSGGGPQEAAAPATARGEGLRILTGAVSSPTLLAQLEGLTRTHPGARWHRWEAAEGHEAEGARLAFGKTVETVYRVAEAEVILAIDSDFLTWGPAAVRYARDFASRRQVEGEAAQLSRLYAVESTFTNTGVTADHRLGLAPHEVTGFALAVAAELGVAEAPPDLLSGFSRPETLSWIPAVVADLRAHAGRALVVAGPASEPSVHALAHAINHALGNVGTTVIYTEPVRPAPGSAPSGSDTSDAAAPSSVGAGSAASLAELVADMRAGRVSTLLILGGNPVFDAPADLEFAAALDAVERKVFVGLRDNETASHCPWVVPQTHYLESWGDGRAYDGSICLTQPLIDPLYDSRTFHQVLAVLEGRTDATPYALVHEYWKSLGVDEKTFRRAVHDGFLPDHGSASASVTPTGTSEAVRRASEAWASRPADGLTLVLRPDPTLHDGRFANLGWLQECPKPLTRLTWDNALLVAPRVAEQHGWRNEEVVALTLAGGSTIEVPVWVLPGHPETTVTLHFGYGRRRTGRIGKGTGVDAYPARTTRHLWAVPAVKIDRVPGKRKALASTQDHFSMENRHALRVATLERYRREPEFARHEEPIPPVDETFYPPYSYDGYAWALEVDLNACTGCNACVVACQAENNISVVGKNNVLNGREMHWIRIDRYFEGSLDDPQVHNQPVMCQQCELAPCEVVCPVEATVHSSEGLNDMVYNRCVGTRYCSNNCPYKVRRFNFLEYNDLTTPMLMMQRNPDVTVRERGVMEKCTYCVQRINGARQQSKVEGRKVRDGDILTACQQVCPAGAIVFGDSNDPQSEVSRWKARPTAYALLGELNTRPRTGYLAKVSNPNPALRG